MPLDAVDRRVFVVMVVHRRPPVPGRLAAQHLPHGLALDIVGHGDARIIQERRREIQVQHDIVAHRAGLDFLRIAHHQRHPQGFLVHEPLVEPAVIA